MSASHSDLLTRYSKEMYEDAVLSIDKLYEANEYVGIMSSDNQDLMFPLRFIVTYNLWEILHELRYIEFIEMFVESNGGNNTEEHITDLYDLASENVIQNLSTDTDKDVPRSSTNINYVSDMLIEQLREVEQSGDLNSTARGNVIKTKYYLNDDFDDYLFRLDWMFFQMFSPWCNVTSLCSRNTKALRRF